MCVHIQQRSAHCPADGNEDNVQQVVNDVGGIGGVLPSECITGVCNSPNIDNIRGPLLWNRLAGVPNTAGAATARPGSVVDSGMRFNHANLANNILVGQSFTSNLAAQSMTPPTGGGDTVFGHGEAFTPTTTTTTLCFTTEQRVHVVVIAFVPCNQPSYHGSMCVCDGDGHQNAINFQETSAEPPCAQVNSTSKV
eukprot:jgi/Chrzof1/14395/Cz09g00350.t1